MSETIHAESAPRRRRLGTVLGALGGLAIIDPAIVGLLFGGVAGHIVDRERDKSQRA